MITQRCCAGLANDKVIHIEGDGEGVKVTKLISKHANKPSKHRSSSTRKKSFQRVTHGLNKELDGYRPDLKVSRQQYFVSRHSLPATFHI